MRPGHMIKFNCDITCPVVLFPPFNRAMDDTLSVLVRDMCFAVGRASRDAPGMQRARCVQRPRLLLAETADQHGSSVIHTNGAALWRLLYRPHRRWRCETWSCADCSSKRGGLITGQILPRRRAAGAPARPHGGRTATAALRSGVRRLGVAWRDGVWAAARRGGRRGTTSAWAWACAGSGGCNSGGA